MDATATSCVWVGVCVGVEVDDAVPLGVALVVGGAEDEAVLLRVEVAVPDVDPENEGDIVDEKDVSCVPEGDAVPEGVMEGDGVLEGVVEGDGVLDGVLVADGVEEDVAVALREAVAVRLGVCVDVGDGVPDGVAHAVGAAP